MPWRFCFTAKRATLNTEKGIALRCLFYDSENSIRGLLTNSEQFSILRRVLSNLRFEFQRALMSKRYSYSNNEGLTEVTGTNTKETTNAGFF